jgi:hypothetical protein
VKIDEMKTGSGRRVRLGEPRERILSRAAAEDISLQAFSFLARDASRIEVFFSLTGIDASDVRSLARETGFQLAVLDHLAANEPLLLIFAEEEGVAPENVNAARHALGGGDPF